MRFLGRGGRKEVYLATDTRLDREVAVAVIPTEGLDDDGVERVRREAKAMARLGDHPHIVGIYEATEQGGIYLIVSQFMPGGDLSAMIRATADGRLDIQGAIDVSRQLCSALTHAHTRGVFHRDLKPANVFVSGDGSIRLGDFGLARLADTRNLTLSGSFLGTAAYMPPEQALGGQVDARSDLYGLGCVMYEMVAGRPPFTGDDTVGVIGQHLNAVPVPPSWHNRSVPRGFDQLVLELLAKGPSDRPTTALIVAERLATIDLDELPVESEATRATTGSLVLGRLVGRHRELASLRERIDQAVGGQGSMTLLVGEPGIGKTRLSQEAATFAELRDAVVLWGRCYESEAALPYRPWTEILSQYARGRGDADLRLELGSGLDDVARLVSEIGERFGSARGDAARVEAETDRLRLFDNVVSFLVHAAHNKPLLVILDDLHWADTPSLLLLQHLARRLADSRICVIGTYRDVDLDRQHPLSGVIAELRQRRLYDRIRLHGFDIDELRTMLAVAGQQDESTINENFVAALLEETEGNPFFLEETLRHLVEAGKLVRRGTQWVSDATSMADLEIPEGVREVIGRRLSRLSERCNDALRNGAVLGRDFDFGVLRAMTQMSEDDLLGAVEEALEASIIRELRDRPGVATYQFTHALVQQTLVEELSLPRLQRLHFRAAEALEATGGTATGQLVAVLSAHYRAAGSGGDLDKALRYTLDAELTAEDTYAWEDAVALYRAAVELMAELKRPNVEIARHHLTVLTRLGLTAVLPPAEMAAAMEWSRTATAGDPLFRREHDLATVFLAGGLIDGYVPERLDIARSETLLADVDTDDPEILGWITMIRLNTDLMVPRPERLTTLAESVAAESELGAWAKVYRSAAHYLVGETTAGASALMDGWRLSCRSREQLDCFSAHVAVTLDVSFPLGMRAPRRAARFAAEELSLARQSVPRALDIAIATAVAARERGEQVDTSRLPQPEDLPDGVNAYARAYRWLIVARDGQLAGSEATSETTMRLYAAGGAYTSAEGMALVAVELLIAQDELARAEAVAIEALQTDSAFIETCIRPWLALVKAIDGRPDESLTDIERCRELLTDEWGGLSGIVDLSEALSRLALGDRAAATLFIESALASSRREQHPWDEAEMHLRWGQALVAIGDTAAAMPHFDDAVAIYRRVNAGQVWLERVLSARLDARSGGRQRRRFLRDAAQPCRAHRSRCAARRDRVRRHAGVLRHRGLDGTQPEPWRRRLAGRARRPQRVGRTGHTRARRDGRQVDG